LSRLADVIAPARLGRSFRWLLASSWTTNLGDGITLAAGPLLVAAQTHNPLAVAMATFLQRLPWLIFGLYAGVLADRVSRRAIVMTTGLIRVVILVLLTALLAVVLKLTAWGRHIFAIGGNASVSMWSRCSWVHKKISASTSSAAMGQLIMRLNPKRRSTTSEK